MAWCLIVSCDVEGEQLGKLTYVCFPCHPANTCVLSEVALIREVQKVKLEVVEAKRMKPTRRDGGGRSMSTGQSAYISTLTTNGSLIVNHAFFNAQRAPEVPVVVI